MKAGRSEAEANEAVRRIPDPLYLDTYAALSASVAECLRRAGETTDAIAQARLVAAAVPLTEELLLRIRVFKGYDPTRGVPEEGRFTITRTNPPGGVP